MPIDFAAAMLARPSAPQCFADGCRLANGRQGCGTPWTVRTEQSYPPKLRLSPMKEQRDEQNRNTDE
jgi:hypothetical protein